MLYDIDPRERGMMFQNRLAFVETAMSWVNPTIVVLMSVWARELGPVRVAMMVSIVHMSLANGRAACELPLSVFDKGNANSDECPIFAGLGMSINSARTHIDGLCTDNFLNIYRTFSTEGGAEASARVVEIDFRKLFSTEKLAAVGMNLVQYTPSKIWGGPYEYIHRYFVPSLTSFGLGKPNLLPPSFGAADSTGEPMLAVAKKARRVQPREETIAGVLATASATRTEVRNTRVAAAVAAAPKDLTLKGIQALIDTAMEKYAPSNPRTLVTEKPFGVFKKRLKELRIADLGDFIDYTIRSWYSIATQNQAAHRKDISRVQRGSAIPSAPSFTVLAYKLPYFVAVYSNHLMDGRKVAQERSPLEKQVAEMAIQLEKVRKDNEDLRKQRRKTMKTRIQSTPATRKQVELDDDWVPPEWTGREEIKKKA